MSREDRLALRAAIRVGLLALVVAAAAGGQAYGTGRRPLWIALAIGIPVIGLMIWRLRASRGGPSPEDSIRAGAARAGRWLGNLARGAVAAVRRARRRGRVRRVERSARAAAAREEALAPEAVRTAAQSLFRLVQIARDAGDSARLATLLGPELLAGRQARLALDEGGRTGERVEVIGDVGVDYVGYREGGAGDGPRAVVVIEAKLRTRAVDRRGRTGEARDRRVCEFWTLGFEDGAWTALAIEPPAEGARHLSGPLGAGAPPATGPRESNAGGP